MKTRALFLLVLMSFFGCKSTYKNQNAFINKVPQAPDYNLSSSWALLPSAYTEEFKSFASEELDSLQADVFYVYPTMNSDEKDLRWNVSITDLEQNKKVLDKAILMQASAFAIAGKVYVPFYRQAHYRSFKMYDKGGKRALELAYEDVKRAFEIYLEKYNNGRPIILASHSQGTSHTTRLLVDFFDGKKLQEKLIAAYIPGIPILPNQFKTIKPMISPEEIGGFVSWNTFKKGHYPKNVKNWYNGAVTTNPITWDHNKFTTLSQHRGFLFTNQKIYEKALTIEITDGLVWSSNPKFPKRLLMSFIKNYHAGDINLFWQDIRENSVLRVKEYLKKN